MFTPLHRDRLVRHEGIEPPGLVMTHAGTLLGVAARRAMNTFVADRSTRASGSAAESWLRMQMAYDLALLRRRENEIRVERIATPSAG